MFKRKTQGVEAYMLGEGGLDWFKEDASEAFPSGLAQIWAFQNVKWLLLGMYEVLVWSPDVLGVLSRCCLMHLGGSSSESEIYELEGRYGERHINFEQKSIV